MKHFRQIFTSVLVLGFGVFLVQCEENIFSFAAPDKTEASLVEEGRALMNEGKYEDAQEKFADAMVENPTSSAARYYHAKATLHASGFNAIVLSGKLTDASDGQSLPFMDMRRDSANSLYQVNRIIVEDLQPIVDNSISGQFTADDVKLDMTLATTTRGILSFRDTNSDGLINSQDFSIDVLFNNDSEVSIEDLDSLQNNPDDINNMIDNVGALIDDAGSLISDILGDTTSGIDTEAIDQMLQDISGTATFYYINTGTPGNPGEGDNDMDGTIDEECLDGVDNDGDGLVDEDAEAGKICP